MKQVTFVTGNKNKFQTATVSFQRAGFTLIQADIDIDEIQSENSEKIARDKAQKAFDHLQQPIIVSDDTWSIPGLGGFPGPYMKSINSWFQPEDFLRLTKPLQDRRIMMTQYVVFQDRDQQKVFHKQTNGTLRKDISPHHDAPSSRIKSITPDGRALAEVRATSPELLNDGSEIWAEVTDWLSRHI